MRRVTAALAALIALHAPASAQTTFSALDSSPIAAPTGKPGAQIALDGIQFDRSPTLRVELTPASLVRNPTTVKEHLEQLGGVGPNLNRLRFTLALEPLGGDGDDADRIGEWTLGARWDVYNSASPWATAKTYRQLAAAIGQQAVDVANDESFQKVSRKQYMAKLRPILVERLEARLEWLCYHEPAKLDAENWKAPSDTKALGEAREVCSAAAEAADEAREARSKTKTATKKNAEPGNPSAFEITRSLHKLKTDALEAFDELEPKCHTAVTEITERFPVPAKVVEPIVEDVCERSIDNLDARVLDKITRAASGGWIVTLEGQIRRRKAEMEGGERQRELTAQALVTYRAIQPVYTCELAGLAGVGLLDGEEPTSRLGVQINCDPARGRVFGSGVVTGFEVLLDSEKTDDGSDRAWFLQLGPKLSVPIDKRVQAGVQVSWSRRTDAAERFESRATFLLAWTYDQSGKELERQIRFGDRL